MSADWNSYSPAEPVDYSNNRVYQKEIVLLTPVRDSQQRIVLDEWVRYSMAYFWAMMAQKANEKIAEKPVNIEFY